MATLPTKEENAQKVLEVFSHFRARPGHVLLANNFVAIGSRRRWEMSDLQQGLEFASSQGWVTDKNGGIELTEQGFAKMP
jgi:hypothetical protein